MDVAGMAVVEGDAAWHVLVARDVVVVVVVGAAVAVGTVVLAAVVSVVCLQQPISVDELAAWVAHYPLLPYECACGNRHHC